MSYIDLCMVSRLYVELRRNTYSSMYQLNRSSSLLYTPQDGIFIYVKIYHLIYYENKILSFNQGSSIFKGIFWAYFHILEDANRKQLESVTAEKSCTPRDVTMFPRRTSQKHPRSHL
jgi:hypothetical protein